MFSISFDETQRLIHVVRSGFPNLAEVERYEQDIRALVTRVRSGAKSFDVLIDSSAGGVLAQEVVETLTRVSRLFAEAGVRKLAVVNASTIKALQTKRTVGGALHMQMFHDTESALAWLREQD